MIMLVRIKVLRLNLSGEIERSDRHVMSSTPQVILLPATVGVREDSYTLNGNREVFGCLAQPKW